MLNEIIYLREEDKDIKMESFIHNDEGGAVAIGRRKRPAMVVLAGGGYLFQANDREGEPIAINYFAKGFNCFMVNYSVNDKAKFPRPVVDVSRAIVHIKRNAEKYNVDPDRVYVIGFSAGGHLAASIGTFWAEEWAKSDPDMKPGENKPAAVLTCYPVITGEKEFYHHDSFMRILGYPIETQDVPQEELDLYSVDKHINENTVPAFIWHTFEDDCVPLENVLLYARALKAGGVHFEMHIYPKGYHAFALANRETWWGSETFDDPHVAQWFADSLEFLKIF